MQRVVIEAITYGLPKLQELNPKASQEKLVEVLHKSMCVIPTLDDRAYEIREGYDELAEDLDNNGLSYRNIEMRELYPCGITQARNILVDSNAEFKSHSIAYVIDNSIKPPLVVGSISIFDTVEIASVEA